MLAEQQRHWGLNPPQNQEFARGIAEVAGVKVPGAVGRREQYKEKILAALKETKIDQAILDRLEIKFLEDYNRHSFGEIRVHGNDAISQVKVGIFGIFGLEILTRLELSLKD